MFAAMYENLLSEERLITRLANKMGAYGLLGHGEPALRVDDDSVGELVETIDQRADSGTVQ
jgi:hypothetical protein